MQSLPVSRLIKIAAVLTAAGAQAQNLSTLLVLGSSPTIDVVERIRDYSSLSEVALDFAGNTPEYQAAALYFGQAPQPTLLKIGRWAKTATAGTLRGAPLSAAQQAVSAWTSISNGAFTYSKDGGAATTVATLNFSAATSMNSVASIITAGLTGATMIWNAVQQRFELTSATTGPSSSISFLTAPGSGTDISNNLAMRSTSSGAYVANGIAQETALEAVTLFDDRFGQSWYALTMREIASSADHLAVAGFVEGANNKHFYGITSSDAGILVAATTTDIASLLKVLNYNRTAVQYSSSNPDAIVSAFARILTTDYLANNTTITLMYKQEPGVVAETLSTTQVNALEAKNCNVLVTYNNSTAIFEKGQVPSGNFIDEIMNIDWLVVTAQQRCYNLLYTSTTKIPQTDSGTALLVAEIEATCAQGVVNGMFAPGTWNSSGFGTLKQGAFLPKGYYIYAPPVASQNPADRAARKSVSIQVAGKLAGAIHEVIVNMTINQ